MEQPLVRDQELDGDRVAVQSPVSTEFELENQDEPQLHTSETANSSQKGGNKQGGNEGWENESDLDPVGDASKGVANDYPHQSAPEVLRAPGELQATIDQTLRSSGVYESIRKTIADYFLASSEISQGGTDAEKKANDAEVIETLLASLMKEKQLSSTLDEKKRTGLQSPDPEWQYLKVKLLPGAGFLSMEAQDPETTLSGTTPSNLVVKLHHKSQRFESGPTPFISEEPQFKGEFYVKLCKLPRSGGSLDPSSALRLLSSDDHPLHIVLMRINSKSSDPTTAKELLASHELEWRRVLSRPHGASVAVELTSAGVNQRSNLPVGVLNLKLDFVPPLRMSGSSQKAIISDAQVLAHLDKQVAENSVHSRRFFQYAKVWWQEYADIDPSFRHRSVKIFAENEWGENRPVCTYITPLETGREIDTPQIAARFVSLIPYVREETIGGGRLDVWQSLHAFLSQGRGDVENHAVLLCSLLLGFGMEAYVCIGTALDEGKEREHYWVATLQHEKVPRKAATGQRVTFWESLTAQRVTDPHRVTHNDPANGHCYARISCLFNDREYYANRHLDDRIVGMSFDLTDPSLWKAMDKRLIEPLRHQRTVPLITPSVDHRAIASAIEDTLRGLVSSFRTVKLNVSTKWDTKLEYYLSAALSAYETERVALVMPPGNEDFTYIIKKHVPVGFSFKGYPAMFNHCSPQIMFDDWSGTRLAQDIIKTTSDAVAFAIRCRVYQYPENVFAVWVMLAVVYRP